MDEAFPTAADFKETLGQFSALTTFMFVDGKGVLALLSDNCKAELRRMCDALCDELQQYAKEINHG
ncbi:hypothetical protein AWB69_00006 [Caballeronia udeis]|uniref:Uncharacterized protein n=1 Tax=Caballeronia udeis TaxID=1232866 RepID=A0A158ENV6_9BURK|nr:hypothetical protein [Caballeronia udeis]SAL09251.1 hypothetical protein AWB69_00006 [Caballeronia udeis]